jgi:effector-binding domain-containing protein
MKIGEPKLEERNEQQYVGIRTQTPVKNLQDVIPQLLDELFGWLGQRGIAPAGAPFIRYYVINMEADMDVELGVPVATAVPGDNRVSPGVLPSGRYAALTYTGVMNGIEGNKALIEWAAKEGLQWDRWEAENGDAFAARYESFLTDPAGEPDPAKWETEVAIKIAGKG